MCINTYSADTHVLLKLKKKDSLLSGIKRLIFVISCTMMSIYQIVFVVACIVLQVTAFRSFSSIVRTGAHTLSMNKLAPGVEFNTIAREWRFKWSADSDKKSLASAQQTLQLFKGALKVRAEILPYK